MGSLRNPVGPLPSTIYWRRRAVAATLIALLALLVVWVVTSRGGDSKNSGDTSDGANPATSITPGPSGSGPAISEQPGGRDESGSTDGTGGGTGGGQGGTDGGADGGKNGDTGGGGGAGSSGTDGTADAGGASGGASGGGTAGGDGGSAGSGRQVPAGSGLPNCPPSALTLRLTTTKVAYAPGEKPAFRLIATNTSGTTCKADFGPKAMVLTITNADDQEIWSSDHCPKTGGVLYEVPAGGTITRTIEWDRRQSAPRCATPPAAPVSPGTYLVEAKTSGAAVKQGQASIRLEKD
ncbi:hypothetical protein ACFRMN_24775 [Streptomyces sp. NPDC056835]|uniref:hypothetical protein n=1 Tax=Streptomyces sp. NPDC056835 TaxID=3345956 RepID=UPI0036A3E6DC